MYYQKRVSLSLRITHCRINATHIFNTEGFYPWAATGWGFSPKKSKAFEAKLLFTPFTCFRKYLAQFSLIWFYVTENMSIRKNGKRMEQNKIYFTFADVVYIISEEWRLHANHGNQSWVSGPCFSNISSILPLNYPNVLQIQRYPLPWNKMENEAKSSLLRNKESEHFVNFRTTVWRWESCFLVLGSQTRHVVSLLNIQILFT